jgi:hypothetical protein
MEKENMAWRPTKQLIEGELDNTIPGKVTGWMEFTGMKKLVRFDLEGDFHRDIKGNKIKLFGDGEESDYMNGFSPEQVGSVGDITAGLEPQDYVNYPYIEWYSQTNGRVVLELDDYQVEVIGEQLEAEKQKSVSRKTV